MVGINDHTDETLGSIKKTILMIWVTVICWWNILQNGTVLGKEV
jgi:hypothetical protein